MYNKDIINIDMFLKMSQCLAILWTFELLLRFNQFFPNKVGITYAPIINRINYLSENENVLYSKNDKIITETYLKSLGTNKRR